MASLARRDDESRRATRKEGAQRGKATMPLPLAGVSQAEALTAEK